jgi:HK97 family phage major capsid protein
MRGVIATSQRPEPGLMASLAKSLALGGGRFSEARTVAEQLGVSDRVKNVIKSPVPAHWTGDPNVAGLVDAQHISTQFQAFIRNSSLFYRALDNGMVRVGLRERVGWTTATATGFVASEGAAVPVARMAVEAAGIKRLKANGLIVLTREMLRTAGTAGEALIARELRRAVSQSVDEQFIEIVLDDVTPLPSNGTDAQAAARDLADLLSAVQPTAESRLLFGASADVARAASTLLTASGGFLFPEMSPTGGRMLGIDVQVSDALDVGQLMLMDAGGIAGESELITVQASDDTTIEMESEPEGSAVEPTATEKVSMFQTNSTAIMSTAWFGAKRFRDDAVAIIDGIAWGDES